MFVNTLFCQRLIKQDYKITNERDNFTEELIKNFKDDRNFLEEIEDEA